MNQPTTLTSEAMEVMQLLREYGITPTGLREVLETPALTSANVQTFLNRCTKEELAILFYTSGLVKLTEIVKQAHEAKQQQPQPRESTAV